MSLAVYVILFDSTQYTDKQNSTLRTIVLGYHTLLEYEMLTKKICWLPSFKISMLRQCYQL